MNKLMQRIFTAQDRKEDKLLNQVQDDLELAQMEGQLDTDEFSMKKDNNGNIIVHDKVNNEDTKFTINDNEFTMEDLSNKLIELGTQVTWTDSDGTLHEGILVSINDNYATVNENGVNILVEYNLLTQTGVNTYSASNDIMIANINGYDCIFNLKLGSIEIPEEKFKMKFKLDLPFNKVINMLVDKLDKLRKPVKKSFSMK